MKINVGYNREEGFGVKHSVNGDERKYLDRVRTAVKHFSYVLGEKLESDNKDKSYLAGVGSAMYHFGGVAKDLVRDGRKLGLELRFDISINKKDVKRGREKIERKKSAKKKSKKKGG